MPTPPPPKEHRFKPGQSGNPEGGRRQISGRRLRRSAREELSKEQVVKLTNVILTSTIEEVEIKAKDKKKTNAVEGMIYGQVVAAAKGNPSSFRAVMEFLFGRPNATIEITGAIDVTAKTEALTDEELNRLYQERLEMAQKLLGPRVIECKMNEPTGEDKGTSRA